MGLTYIKSRFLHPVKMKWYDLQIEIIGAWKFFLKRQRSGERKLTKIHYQSTDKICGNKRSTVIYMANGYTWHGGLADRLKGIVSLYAWCSDHSKPFKINFCHPFRLHNYLIPNEYDWQIADEDISYNPCEVAVKQCLIAPVLAVPTVQPRLQEISGITSKNGRNDAKRLNIRVVTVSNDDKPKNRKTQRKADLRRRMVCKSLPVKE